MTRHQWGVLDTPTVINVRKITDVESLPIQPLITTITLAELSVGPLLVTDETARANWQAHLQRAEASFEPLPFDAAAARLRRCFGVTPTRGLQDLGPRLRCHDRREAISRNLPVYTCNSSDFEGINTLKVVPIDIPD